MQTLLWRVMQVALVSLPLLWLAAAIVLSEGAVRIPPQVRSRTTSTTPPPDVSIPTRDGIVLQAWTVSPESGWDGQKAALLLHGVADSHMGSLGLARMLARHGYRTLSPDSRGHGVSGGEQISYGLNEREDVHAWADWMRENWRPRDIVGMGRSMGAAILLQSLNNGTDFRAIVAECPFSTFRQIAYHRVRQAGGPLLVPAVEPALLYTRLRYGIDLSNASPEAVLRANAGTPVLFIHGAEDTNIPPAQSRELYASRPAHSELWIVPGGHHVDSAGIAGASYEERVIGWFDRYTSVSMHQRDSQVRGDSPTPINTPSATTSRRQ